MNNTNEVVKAALMFNLESVVKYASRKIDGKSLQVLHASVGKTRMLMERDGVLSWRVRCLLHEIAESGIPASLAFDIKLNLANAKMLSCNDYFHPGDVLDEQTIETEKIAVPVTSFSLLDGFVGMHYNGGRMAIDDDSVRDMASRGVTKSNGVTGYRCREGWIFDDILTGHRAHLGFALLRQILESLEDRRAQAEGERNPSVQVKWIRVVNTSVTLLGGDKAITVTKDTFRDMRWKDGPITDDLFDVECRRVADGWHITDRKSDSGIFLSWDVRSEICKEHPSLDD